MHEQPRAMPTQAWACHPAMATYRVQLNRDFRFEDARGLVPYLSRLGITHLYASPILRARLESTHGYDVVDPKTLNPNLGDETAFRDLVAALHAHGMGVILDIVPNHMATTHENPYWREVLTYGPGSPHARWFDIDWRLADARSWGRVLVPVLGEPLSRVLAHDRIRVVWDEGRFTVRYFDHIFPLDPATVPAICRFGLADLDEVLPTQHPARSEIRDVLARLSRLPRRVTRVRRQVELPLDEIEVWLGQLAQRIEASPQTRDWAVRTCERFGEGDAGRSRLRKLLDAQSYRLVYWRRAARAVNYRRFFDINDLISVRQEDPEVFAETHTVVRRWIREGLLDGLRIDHLDGLRDPLGYLHRLVEMAEEAGRPAIGRMLARTSASVDSRAVLATSGSRTQGTGAAPAFEGDQNGAGQVPVPPAGASPLHIFVEKILAYDEHLPAEWPVSGTTGYEFLNQAEALLIDPQGFAAIEEHYVRLLGRPVRFRSVAAWGKRRVLKNDLSAFVGRLAEMLVRLAHYDDRLRDLTRQVFADAIREVVVALPVYRTYLDDHGTMSPSDRRHLEDALARAARSQRASDEALAFLSRVLLLEPQDDLPVNVARERISFIQRFQQLTGPAAAKGIEDTALYAYVPLASRNEVGSEPSASLEDAVGDLHRENGYRLETFPFTMLAATTHDTKRTADVRSRLDVLSEIPKLWKGYVKRWQRLNRPHRARVSGRIAPEHAAEYLFYQNLVGLWPAPDPRRAEEGFPDPSTLAELRERVEQYMLKAVREAKTRTSWVRPDAAYEDALVTFIRSAMLAPDAASSPFLNDVQQLVSRIARPGFWNACARTLIQFTAPGTPDLYQGDELWNFALVDPDNRRPVDYDTRRELLNLAVMGIDAPEAEQRSRYLASLVQSPEDGAIKLHVIRCALHARREYPTLFAIGQYEPLTPVGEARDHVFAFARRSADQAAIVVVPRLTMSLLSDPSKAPIGSTVWGDTRVPLGDCDRGRTWTSLLTRKTLATPSVDGAASLQVAKALDTFPVALLIGD